MSPPTHSTALGTAQARVLDVVDELASELRGGGDGRQARLDDSLERDLGISSLERVELLVRLEEGNGKAEDIDLMDRICTNMMGNTVCVLADAAAMPTQSYLTKFRDEFVAHVTEGGCSLKKAAAQPEAA